MKAISANPVDYKVRKRAAPAEGETSNTNDEAPHIPCPYPNLFYYKKHNGKGDGKELCDMLVVCGHDVIIFSDKHIKYQEDQPIDVAWPRFYRKAIEGSAKQINGANNWITRYPEDISRRCLHAEVAN